MFLYYHCDLKEKTNDNEKRNKDEEVYDFVAGHRACGGVVEGLADERSIYEEG
jgi:hypothetical protein